MLKIFNFTSVGERVFSNTYIISDEKNNILVVDPGKDDSSLKNYIVLKGYSLKGILLTHGHFDHIGGVDVLFENFHCPIYGSFSDFELFSNNKINCSLFINRKISIKSKITFINDKDFLSLFDGEEIKVISTPFHTEGSVCYYFKKSRFLFSGDTLFRLVIGRTDLPTGDKTKVFSSLKRIKDLPDDVVVYPGHGEKTSLKEEKLYNPYLK